MLMRIKIERSSRLNRIGCYVSCEVCDSLSLIKTHYFPLKSDFVVLIASPKVEEDVSQVAAQTLLKTLLEYLPLKTAVKIVSEHYNLNKNALLY